MVQVWGDCSMREKGSQIRNDIDVPVAGTQRQIRTQADPP
jgi:hypothetical protein